jgi:hypothetical protein
MATVTPKLQLKKPVPNVETDWAFRLNETIDLLDEAMLTGNVQTADGIELIDDGLGNPTISGNRGEMLTISGSLQGQIFTNDTDIATNASQIVSVSGHLQSNIDAIDDNVTLQDAFDNGLGDIVTTSGKSFDVSGAGGIVAVTGTFSNAFRLPQYATDPATIDGDVWINTTTSGIRWQVASVKYEIVGTVV